MGDKLPEWCDEDNERVTKLRSKISYNVENGKFDVRNLSTERDGWILARDLFVLQDRQLKIAIDTALPKNSTSGNGRGFESAKSIRDEILNFVVSIEVLELSLLAAVEAFERLNAGGKAATDDELLLAGISGQSPGLASNSIRPYAAKVKALLPKGDLTKAVTRTLITEARYQSDLETTSRLTRTNLADITQSVWKPSWAAVEKAWNRVFEYLKTQNIDASILPGSNPLVPLVLFALRFPDMFGDEHMLELYLLCLRCERFAKHSTDAHEMDVATIFGAADGEEALVTLVKDIFAVYSRDNNGTSPEFTATEMLNYSYKEKNYALFLSSWAQRESAVDWMTGSTLRYTRVAGKVISTALRTEFHHVCPKKWAKDNGALFVTKERVRNPGKDQEIDSVANIVLVEDTTNNGYSSKAPGVALAEAW